MAVYQHAQELKKAEQLLNGDKIGVCLTCRHWDVEKTRTEALVPYLALCMQPELEVHQLIVSGSSACNKWEKHPAIAEDAESYSHRGEEVVSEKR